MAENNMSGALEIFVCWSSAIMICLFFIAVLVRVYNKRCRSVKFVPGDGVFVSGSWPKNHRRIIGFVIFCFGIIPCCLELSCIVLGGILSALEGWPFCIGFAYVISNVTGISVPLTLIVPETGLGIAISVVISTIAMVFSTTVVGLVSGLSLLVKIFEMVPSTFCGFVCYLFVFLPLLVMLFSFLLGVSLAQIEGWTINQGFLFMFSDISGLSNPLVNVHPETSLGIHFEVIAMILELSLLGAFIGMVAGHPLSFKLLYFVEGDFSEEGTYAPGIDDEDSSDYENYEDVEDSVCV